ncbi:phosphomannomutase, partial [Escherichia coli]|nr:phosphomannomutase [Escherichia coli]
PSNFFRNVGFTNYNVAKVNELDGLRIIFDNNDIIHLRASGNAPELRCYVESDDERRAKSIIDSTLKYISKI